MNRFSGAGWSRRRMGDALLALSRAAGLADVEAQFGSVPDDAPIGAWMEIAAARLGLEAEPVNTPYRELDSMIRSMGPGLLALPEGGVLALLRTRGSRAQVIAPDLRRCWLPIREIRDALAAAVEAEARPAIATVLSEAGVPETRREAALTTILAEALGGNRCAGGWLIRLPPEAPMRKQARSAGLDRLLVWLVLCHAANYLLFIAAWILIGRGALSGRLDAGWLMAWGLALATQVPLSMAVVWLQGRFALGTSALVKRRMLQGALKLTPDETRSEGVGRFIGRVNEAEAFEALALGGGLAGALAIIELVLAGLILGAGAGGALHVGLLLAWLVITGGLVARYARRYRVWTEERMQLTHALVEKMVGHRTRLAQERPDQWHDQEDPALRRYLERSAVMDREEIGLTMVAPCWLVAGVLGLVPAFAAGADTTGVAVALGGILLAEGALAAFTAGLVQLVGAFTAWRRVRPLYEAAARSEVVGDPNVVVPNDGLLPREQTSSVLSARELSFRYPSRSAAILERCTLEIEDGDRILLEGPSGGGKSTMASVLVGIRKPDQGLILVRGLDRSTLGEAGWRRRVVTAPQFHENHVLAGTFAFNVLMGHRWPATADDLAQVETLCRELGLGDLLDRMPSGLLQMVGDTGWQLSHGERSRLFIARALIQEADLVILDESFAALDPENLRRAMECVQDRANALLVIAHP